MAFVHVMWLLSLLFLLLPSQGHADEDPILASPLFELPAILKEVQESKKLPRDDESLSCAQRFPKNDSPSCLDESENPIVEYPLSKNCARGTELKLVEAGECENPCKCQDLDGDPDRQSVVSCQHANTQWSCAPVNKSAVK